MSMIERNITEELVHAYVDGQLSPDEHARFEKLLVNDVELSEKVSAYQSQNNLLHELFDPVLTEPVPDQLVTKTKRKTGSHRLLKLVASILLLSTGGLLGWFANENQNKTQFTVVNLAQPATRAHMVYVPEVKHPVEVSADQEKHLVKWLSKRLGKSVNAPNLDLQGFELVGGRLLPANNGPAAQFMYENKSGKRLTLYVRNKTNNENNTAFQFHTQDETKAFYWIDGELGYVLVGDISKTQLLDTANAVYQQLSL